MRTWRTPLAIAWQCPPLSLSGPARAREDRGPGRDEKCPVCGMFVAKYPDWLAGLRFEDGTRAVFDGAKDLFKFLLEPGRYLRGRAAARRALRSSSPTTTRSAPSTRRQPVRGRQRRARSDGARARAVRGRARPQRVPPRSRGHGASSRSTRSRPSCSGAGVMALRRSSVFLQLLLALGLLAIAAAGHSKAGARFGRAGARGAGGAGARARAHGPLPLHRGALHPPPVAGRPLRAVPGPPACRRALPVRLDPRSTSVNALVPSPGAPPVPPRLHAGVARAPQGQEPVAARGLRGRRVRARLGPALHARRCGAGGVVLARAPELVVQRLSAGRHDLVAGRWVDAVSGIRGVAGGRGRLWGYYYFAPLSSANFTVIVPERFWGAPGEAVIGSGVARTRGLTAGDCSRSGRVGRHARRPRGPRGRPRAGGAGLLRPGPRGRGRLPRLFGIPAGLYTDIASRVPNPREVATVARQGHGALHPDARPITRAEIVRTYEAIFDWRSGLVVLVLSAPCSPSASSPGTGRRALRRGAGARLAS